MGEMFNTWGREILVALATALGTWWITREKNNAEVAVIATDAETAKQAIYDKLLTDNKNRIEDLISEVGELRIQMREFRGLVTRLEEELELCRKGISKIIKKSE